MAERRAPYAPEYRRQMVELMRAGRTPGELARRMAVLLSAEGRQILKKAAAWFARETGTVPGRSSSS